LFLDLAGCNIAQLEQCGLSANAIEASPWCTICTPDRFHSFRRDREKSGRMMGVIGLL
jgi:copper oxidase (laccase) domain-containing protein